MVGVMMVSSPPLTFFTLPVPHWPCELDPHAKLSPAGQRGSRVQWLARLAVRVGPPREALACGAGMGRETCQAKWRACQRGSLEARRGGPPTCRTRTLSVTVSVHSPTSLATLAENVMR